MFSAFLDGVFGPLLALPPFFAVLILSVLVSLISVVVTKVATNQHVMKDLKEQLKAYQAEAKRLKDHPDQAMEVQKKAMDVNMKYMMHNMRGTLFTFLPIILIFGWASSHLSFVPIAPGQEFSVVVKVSEGVPVTVVVPEGVVVTTNATKVPDDGQVVFTMKAREVGEYRFDVLVKNQSFYHVAVVGTRAAITPEKSVGEAGLESIRVVYEPVRVVSFPFVMPLFGEYLGWLGAYIICAIVFSMVLRKVFRVH